MSKLEIGKIYNISGYFFQEGTYRHYMKYLGFQTETDKHKIVIYFPKTKKTKVFPEISSHFIIEHLKPIIVSKAEYTLFVPKELTKYKGTP